MTSEAYDIIIVGGGTAGLVLANRLTEDPALQVLVIEAGEDQKDDPRVVVPGMRMLLLKSPSDWNFTTSPQTALGGRTLSIPQGRLLGGSSAINGLTYTPPVESNIAGWAQLGNPGWEWDKFAKASERRALQLSNADQSSNPWLNIWKDTLGGLGFEVSGDLFTGKGNGLVVNPECIDPVTKTRSYARNAYLTPALERGNLSILTGAAVDKIVFEQGTSGKAVAEGVQLVRDGKTTTITARKEVILAAGAINSPATLEKSGIGAADLLKKLDVGVVVDNPHVGENLQNHVMTTLSYEIKDDLESMDDLVRQDPAAVAAAGAAYQKQSGPLATSNLSLTAQLPFPGISGEEGKKDLDQLLASTLDADVGDDKSTKAFDKAHKEFLRSVVYSPDEALGCYIAARAWAEYGPEGSPAPPPATGKYFSIVLLSTHPLSRGSTHITSKSASSPGGVVIDPKYLSHPLDLEILARELRQVETLFASEPLRSQLKPDGGRNPKAGPIGSFADLEKGKEYLRNYAQGADHYAGTCSMMPRELGGVVDAQLVVYGTENLRVCDSSIIPLIPRANLQATVYGVAEHGAAIIKSSLR